MRIDPEQLIAALKKRDVDEKSIDKLIEEAANEKISLYDMLLRRNLLSDEM